LVRLSNLPQITQKIGGILIQSLEPRVFPLYLGEGEAPIFPEERQNHHTEEAKSSPREAGQLQCPQSHSQKELWHFLTRAFSPWILKSGESWISQEVSGRTQPRQITHSIVTRKVRRKPRTDSLLLVARESLHIDLIKSRLNSAKDFFVLSTVLKLARN
jgi:hypothetical protein